MYVYMYTHHKAVCVVGYASICLAVCCSVLQCVAVCCSVLQCVAVCCSVLLDVPWLTTHMERESARTRERAIARERA